MEKQTSVIEAEGNEKSNCSIEVSAPSYRIVISGLKIKMQIFERIFEDPNPEDVKLCERVPLMHEDEDAKGSEEEKKASQDESREPVKENADDEGSNKQEKSKQPKAIRKCRKLAEVKIPELEEIAKKADSFENFVTLIAEWLKMGNKTEFFKNIAIIFSDLDSEDVSWKSIERVLNEKKISYKANDKVACSSNISRELIKYDVTILPFLKAVSNYKETFIKEVSDDEANAKEESHVEEKSAAKETKVVVKMNCMPNITEFEEVLGMIDKTQSIEERIHYVLAKMGIDDNNRYSNIDKKWLFAIATAAVKTETITEDTVCCGPEIPNEVKEVALMQFSIFVNKYIQKYKKDQKVHVLDFLKDLRIAILTEDEISIMK